MNDQVNPQEIFRALEEIRFDSILLIGFLAWVVIIMVQRGIPWLAERLPVQFRLYILPLVPVIRLVILGLALFEILTLIVEPTPQNLLAIAGASAVAIGFAFKDYASSIVAGMVVLYEQPYRPGDWVQIGQHYGEVRNVGLRAIKIVTLEDTTVTIPHLRIWTDNIANANYGRRDHMVIADFFVTADHDSDLVRSVLADVALTSPYTHIGRPIQAVIFARPWATHYRLMAYPIENRNELLFISDMTVKGKAALAALGVKLANLPPAYAGPLGYNEAYQRNTLSNRLLQ